MQRLDAESVKERRGRLRRDVELNVNLQYRNHRGAVGRWCRTRDLGLGGAFIGVERCPLPCKTPVELVFLLRAGSVIRLYRLGARVVRRSEEGLGLVFDHFDTRTFQALLEVLSWGDQPPRGRA
ncbi:PilZ domain-containing protein [Ectothiorhodospiraceae bacterium 2226]|nr:PilZ domain-containing protein [Ectothiorhodospiraceae bacterium 2226]